MGQRELDVEAGQRQPPDGPVDVLELGLLRAQETPPGGRVEEQVAHLDRRPPGMGGRHGLRDHAVIGTHAPGVVAAGGAGRERQPRHGGDARQRLAAEAEGGDGLEVIEAVDLAGGVPGEREAHFLLGDAAAVVAHPDEARPARLDLHLDAPGAGVQAVLHQLLHHGSRALDDLAGGDLVHQVFG